MDYEELNLEEVKLKAKEITDFHDLLFKSDDDNDSVKEQINELREDLDSLKEQQKELIRELSDFYEVTLIDHEDNESTKTKIDRLTDDINDKLSHIEKRQKLIEGFYEEAFEGTVEETSYQSQFKSAITSINKSLSDTEDEIQELQSFYDKVVDVELKDGTIKKGLSSTVNSLRTQLNSLIENANNKLHALTDSALHNSFAVRAKDYTTEFQKLQKFTFWSILGLIIDILIFGSVQIVLNSMDKPFNYNILIYQFSIAGALIIAIWMFNRNQKIAKKLAEEYHHKASLAEAMTGYRSLYGLDHGDEEYMELFNSIKEHLNVNPSQHIDSFLNLKSPQEEVTGIVGELLNPKNLGELAKQLKPIMDKIK